MIFHSSFEYYYLWLPVLGFIIGFLASLTGSGGGTVILPILTILFDVPAPAAVTTTLVSTLAICLAGSVSHYYRGSMDIRAGLVFSVSGIAGAFTGAGLTSLVTSKALKLSFGVYCIFVALIMIYSIMSRNYKENNPAPLNSGMRKILKGTFFGFMGGMVTGTFGTSGAAPVMAGLFSIRTPMALVAGTSLMIVFINTIAAMGAHFVVGEIDLTLVCFLASGSVIGSLLGPVALAGVNLNRYENRVRVWYAAGMIVLGILMITKG